MTLIQPPHEERVQDFLPEGDGVVCEEKADGCVGPVKRGESFWIVGGDDDVAILTCINPACTQRAIAKLSKEDV